MSTNKSTKNINIVVTQDQHETLEDAKGDRTWRQLLFDGVEALEEVEA